MEPPARPWNLTQEPWPSLQRRSDATSSSLSAVLIVLTSRDCEHARFVLWIVQLFWDAPKNKSTMFRVLTETANDVRTSVLEFVTSERKQLFYAQHVRLWLFYKFGFASCLLQLVSFFVCGAPFFSHRAKMPLVCDHAGGAVVAQPVILASGRMSALARKFQVLCGWNMFFFQMNSGFCVEWVPPFPTYGFFQTATCELGQTRAGLGHAQKLAPVLTKRHKSPQGGWLALGPFSSLKIRNGLRDAGPRGTSISILFLV